VLQTNKFDVAIFTRSSGQPITYTIPFDAQYLGYDNAGNLFVDGYGKPLSTLYELPKNGNAFSQISVSPSLVVRPGQVQWDGNYITIEGIGIKRGVALYRLSVSGSTATVVGTTNFQGVTRTALQSWIQGDRIFIPYGSRGNGSRKVKVGVWKYPAGGKALQKIRHFDKNADLQAVTFSVASRH
jgi:PKD repeat protein